MKNEIERKYNNKDIKDIIDLSSKEYIFLLNTRSFDEERNSQKRTTLDREIDLNQVFQHLSRIYRMNKLGNIDSSKNAYFKDDERFMNSNIRYNGILQ